MKHAQFNLFDFEMPDEAVAECSHQGDCEDDVIAWHPKIDLSHISDKDLAEELRSYGCWNSEELKCRTKNEQRIIWIAAADIQEEEFNNQKGTVICKKAE